MKAGASILPGSRVPVIVFLHDAGNDFATGGTDASVIQGDILASTGNVVVVTVSYRVGIFGFSVFPEVGLQGSTNIALLDQQLALKWVKNHIAAFGSIASVLFGSRSQADFFVHLHQAATINRLLCMVLALVQ